MIIIHSDPSSNPNNPIKTKMIRGGSGCADSSSSSSSSSIIRLSRKDWVKFDSEGENSDSDDNECENHLKHIEIDKETNRLNLQLDMRRFESVEINFVKKRRRKHEGNVEEDIHTNKAPIVPIIPSTTNRNNMKTRIFLAAGEVLIRNQEILKESQFYYERGEYDADTCTKLLSTTPPGTFLIRDSSDRNYLFTLSLQTEMGPTSVRLVYYDGEFRLDAADQKLMGTLPGFKNVVQLVQYYVESNKNAKNKRKMDRNNGKGGNRQVWIDSATGRTHSVVKLTSPLRHQVPTMKHLSRLAINRLMNQNCDNNNTTNTSSSSALSLSLPEPVRKYLNSYPFIL